LPAWAGSAESGTSSGGIADGLRREFEAGFMPIEHGVALPHLRMKELGSPALMMVRTSAGIRAAEGTDPDDSDLFAQVRAVLFVLSPADDQGYHLRLLGHLASLVEQDGFIERWIGAGNGDDLRAALMDQEHLLTVVAETGRDAAPWIGVTLRDLQLPQDTLVVAIRRGNRLIVPRGDTIVESGDALTLIGEPEAVRALEPQLQAARDAEEGAEPLLAGAS
jgi:mannitol/fructose-specific phosphotransferase system IIA component (Ntr-type)